MPNYRLPLTLNALMQQSAPTNALVQRNVPNFDLLGVSQPVQNNASNFDPVYASFVDAAKRGAAMRNQRTPIVRPDGVTEYNPLTKEESDLINHPSVKWMKKQAEESKKWFMDEFGKSHGKYNPSDFRKAVDANPGSFLENPVNRIDLEYARHAQIIGELAKRNPQVLYEAGILDDGVNRINPNAPKLSARELLEPL